MGFSAFQVPGGRWPGGQVDFNFGQDYINFLGDISIFAGMYKFWWKYLNFDGGISVLMVVYQF